MSDTQKGKKFTVKHAVMIDKKHYAQGVVITLSEAKIKEIEKTRMFRDLIPVEKTETK